MDSSDASFAGKTSNLRMVSLFCGCGGFDLGVKGGFDYLGHHYGENGVDIVFANDIDAAAAKMYQANFGQVPDLRDINEIDSSKIPSQRKAGVCSGKTDQYGRSSDDNLGCFFPPDMSSR